MTGAAARRDGRAPDQLRPVKIELGVNVHAEGSCLIEMGRTRVWITGDPALWTTLHHQGRRFVDSHYRSSDMAARLLREVYTDQGLCP